MKKVIHQRGMKTIFRKKPLLPVVTAAYMQLDDHYLSSNNAAVHNTGA